MEKPKYILLEGYVRHDCNDFNNDINTKLNEGYILYGNTFNNGSYIYQAVILPGTDRSDKINKN